MRELLALLQEFHGDKLTELLRHEAGARLVTQYDANNTYQYIINREETQLTWLATAIEELGGSVVRDDGQRPAPIPAAPEPSTSRSVVADDVRRAQAFVDRWRPRVDAMTHARHRGMLQVILGETLEHKRFFEQALAGQLDLLGRRTEETGPRVGRVLPVRWKG